MKKYDNETMVYLALMLFRETFKNDEYLYIDVFYEEIKKIYEQFILEDNSNLSLLDSIYEFIDNHKEELTTRLKKANETF